MTRVIDPLSQIVGRMGIVALHVLAVQDEEGRWILLIIRVAPLGKVSLVSKEGCQNEGSSYDSSVTSHTSPHE